MTMRQSEIESTYKENSLFGLFVATDGSRCAFWDEEVEKLPEAFVPDTAALALAAAEAACCFFSLSASISLRTSSSICGESSHALQVGLQLHWRMCSFGSSGAIEVHVAADAPAPVAEAAVAAGVGANCSGSSTRAGSGGICASSSRSISCRSSAAAGNSTTQLVDGADAALDEEELAVSARAAVSGELMCEGGL